MNICNSRDVKIIIYCNINRSFCLQSCCWITCKIPILPTTHHKIVGDEIEVAITTLDESTIGTTAHAGQRRGAAYGDTQRRIRFVHEVRNTGSDRQVSIHRNSDIGPRAVVIAEDSIEVAVDRHVTVDGPVENTERRIHDGCSPGGDIVAEVEIAGSHRQRTVLAALEDDVAVVEDVHITQCKVAGVAGPVVHHDGAFGNGQFTPDPVGNR